MCSIDFHFFFIMKYTALFFALIFIVSYAQEYTMGTKEQPKADLPVDDQLIIQNIVFVLYILYGNSTCLKNVLKKL